jgi:hypothetical protein
MKKRLTNKDGEVKEISGRRIKQMKPMPEALPSSLQRVIKARNKKRNDGAPANPCPNHSP